jgi:hypothetical protein
MISVLILCDCYYGSVDVAFVSPSSFHDINSGAQRRRRYFGSVFCSVYSTVDVSWKNENTARFQALMLCLIHRILWYLSSTFSW